MPIMFESVKLTYEVDEEGQYLDDLVLKSMELGKCTWI